MVQSHCLHFGPFCLETREPRLWRGEQCVPLRRQALAVLHYLALRPKQVISKEELLRQLWGGTAVSRTVLRVCIREIRHALGEQARTPQYIETVGYEGYRFCAVVKGIERIRPSGDTLSEARVAGRRAELEQLQRALSEAARGARRLVLIGGDIGIGKTALVETFLARCEAEGHVQVARGQCVENRASEIPYLPLFDALEQLCQTAHGDVVRDVLHREAPMCLSVLPGVGDAEAGTHHRVEGIAETQFFLELTRALEALSAQTPLILLLEDLHACDDATMTLLSFLTRRHKPARLVVIGVYRPEAVWWPSPLVLHRFQALQSLGLCVTLHLDRLCREDAVDVAESRLGGPVAETLATWLMNRTDGHPLCLEHVCRDLQQRGWLWQQGDRWVLKPEAEEAPLSIPLSLHHQITRQFASLPPGARQILKAASVAGQVFETATVAKRLKMTQEMVERSCQDMVDTTSLLVAMGLAPGRGMTVSGQYRFRYPFYRDIVAERVSAWEWEYLQGRVESSQCQNE
ncbi:MAG: hypothetical protein ETSY2_43645, partial [Candidatus Entotheonella gemina]